MDDVRFAGMCGVGFADLDEDTLGQLLYVAMTDAEPSDVMAPMDGNPGWTPERTELFLAGHRRNRRGEQEANRQVTMAVVHNGAVAGSVRFEPIEDGTREIGLWLSRSHRGYGLSTQVLQLGADFARDELGACEVFANTSSTNLPAVTALRHAGYDIEQRPDGRVWGMRRLRP
jgi:RimJ/RimL family protein N-acetyltransferase